MIPTSTAWNYNNLLPSKRRVTTVAFSATNNQQTAYPRVFTTQNTQIDGQYPWIVSIDGGGYKADDFSGWAQRDQVTINVLNYGNAFTNDLATYILDGQSVLIKSGFWGMQQSDFATLATLQVEKVEPAGVGETYNIHCRDLGIEMGNPIYSFGDDGWPTGQNHKRNPALPILTRANSTNYPIGYAVIGSGLVQMVYSTTGPTGGGTPGWSTTIGGFTTDGSTTWICLGYNPSSPMTLLVDAMINQIGYDPSRIDWTTLSYYTQNLFVGLQMVFSLDTAPEAEEYLNTEIFKALFGYGYWNYAGQLVPHFHAAKGVPAPVMDLWDGVNTPTGGFATSVQAAILSPLPVESAGDYYTTVSYRCDYDGQNYMSEIVSAFGTSEPFDLTRQQIIQAKGVRTPLGGALYARLVSNTLFQRYGVRPTLLDVELDWTGIRLELGNQVSVSHPLIMDKLAGLPSLNNKLFEVVGVTPNWNDGTVSVNLLDISYLSTGPWFVATNGTASWPSGGAATSKMYIASEVTGEYSDGTAGRVIYP